MSTNQEEPAEANAEDMSYPSPGAEPMDAGSFYQAAPRDSTQNQEQAEHEAQEVQEVHEAQDAQDVQEMHAAHEAQNSTHDHNELKDHDQVQNDLSVVEPATPQHAQRQPNLEELQLAAQLGQGLAGTTLIPGTEANMNVDDPNLRNIMPNHETEQQHAPSYMHDTPTSGSMIPHGIPIDMTSGPLTPHYSLGDGVPPRKRSKVSRACDECRRKKIKCDATTDSGETPCSSCARSSMKCMFSRVPQKRGPSKGYIKELADRIHSIEHKLEMEGISPEELDGLLGTERSRLSSAGKDSRKRPYSHISSGQPTTPAENNNTTSFTSAPVDPPHSFLKIDDYSLKLPDPSSDMSMVDSEHQSNLIEAENHSNVTEPNSTQKASEAGLQAEALEVLLQGYLSTLQTIYPILPYNHQRALRLLEACSAPLKLAFTHALLAALQPSTRDEQRASALLLEWEGSDSPRTLAANIVHAQTLILLAINAEEQDTSNDLGWLLWRALDLAHREKWSKYTIPTADEDRDSDGNLCIRIWWSLGVIDRWYAMGWARAKLINDEFAFFESRRVEMLFEDETWYMLRLSNDFISKIPAYIMSLRPAGGRKLDNDYDMLLENINHFIKVLPEHIEAETHPLLHLCVQHCRLVLCLVQPDASCQMTLRSTEALIALLSHNSDIPRSLAKHFSSVVSLSLFKLCRMDESREEAIQLAKGILATPGSVWDKVRSRVAESVHKASSGGGTGAKDGSQNRDASVDGRVAQAFRQGYLQFGPA